ncbi:MAG: tetratricopeptide repeat protein [Candidatus Obscuribacterales bacterium]
MPPLLAGEIEETTGLYDALSRVKDVDINCGVLRIACDDFIGLIGIESASRIVGAVTKDPQAGRLTDSGAVDKILGLTTGTFEYYEVPQKELSRLNQNLEMDIAELLSSHANNGGEAAADSLTSESDETYAEESGVVYDEGTQEALAPESVQEQEELAPESSDHSGTEDSATYGESEELVENVQEHSEAETLAEDQTEPAYSKSELDSIGTSNYSKSELDSIGTSNYSKSELDSIGTSNYSKSELDSIGTTNYSKSELDSIGTANYSKSELDSIGTTNYSKSELDSIGVGSSSTEEAEAPKVSSKPGNLLAKFKKDSKAAATHTNVPSAESFAPGDSSATSDTAAPFDPATDALTLSAQANVERLKKFRPPDAEIEAEAARAQRMKFASKKAEPINLEEKADSAEDAARAKNIRPTGPQQLPPPSIRPTKKVTLSPKVGIALGGVVGLVALFFVVRIPVANSLVASAESQFNKRDFKGAESTISPVFFFDPSNTQAHYLKGKILGAQGKLAQAFEEYDQALNATPLDGQLLRAHALAAWKLNKHAVLKKDTDALIENDPTAKADGFLYGLRAKAELDLNDAKGAYDDCTTALRLGQRAPWIYARRGWALVKKGNPKAALKDFNTAISFPKNDATADAYVGKGAALRDMNDTAGALAAYDAALKVDPKSAPIYATRAWLYGYLNKFDKALADYNTALHYDPGYVAAYIAIADIYTRQNKLDAALKELLAVPKKYDGFELAIARGRAYMRLNKMKEAIANFKQGFAIDPKRDPDAYMDQAYCYGVMKNYSAALAAVQAAIDINPTNAQYVASHGFYNQFVGNTVTAAQEFEKALSLDPKNADAHFWRGVIFEQKGDSASAIQDYQAALAVNPDYAEAKRKLAALNKVERHSSVNVASASDGIKIIQGDYQTLMNQGYAKMKAHDARAACNYFASAVKVNPNSTQARKYLAYALVMKGNSTDAISEFQSLDASGAADATDRRNLGLLLLEAKRASEAVDVFLKLVTENPKDTYCRLKLAEAYSLSGDLKKAVETCQDGQKVDPASSARYLATIEKLKTTSNLTSEKGKISMPSG